MRPAAVAAVALCAALLGTGCGEKPEPTASAVPLYPVTVRGAGEQPITLEEAPRRIAVVAQGAARILRRLGAADRIVGGPDGDAPRVVTPNGHVLLDRLRRAAPDLLVASTASDPVEVGRAARATQAPLYIAPADSIEGVERAVTELGALAGLPLTARQVVGTIEARRRAVSTRLADRRPVRVFVDVGFFTTVSDRSLIGDLIREARGRNVAGPRPEPGPFDLDALARLDPEVYLATSDSGTTLAGLRDNRKTRRLAAVRRGRFGLIPVELVQPDPRIGRGLEAVARLLHPDAAR